MTPETEALIARVLAHDAKATKGPWTFDDRNDPEKFLSPTRTVCHFGDLGHGWSGENKGYPPDSEDADLIATYRTAAPKLARMLREAIKGLQLDETRGDTEETLAEIERIAKGES